MSEELIELVRKYEALYNPKCKDYKDHLIRTAAWEEIAQKLNETVEQCKDNWTKLRNTYASALKRRKNKSSGQAATQVIAWKYEENMHFLRPHMESRGTKTNLTAPTPESTLDTTPYSPSESYSNESQSSSASQPPPTPTSSAGSQRSSASKRSSSQPGLQEIYDLMKSSNDIKKRRQHFRQDMYETDIFFFSMSKALKELPKIDQTKIKLDLHTAISQAEIRKLERTERVLRTPLNITSQIIIPPHSYQPAIHSPTSIKNSQLLSESLLGSPETHDSTITEDLTAYYEI